MRTAHVDVENLQKAKNEIEMDKVLSLPVGNEELIETSGVSENPEVVPSEPSITF